MGIWQRGQTECKLSFNNYLNSHHIKNIYFRYRKIFSTFEQTPNSHLHGSGCFRCGIEALGSKLRSTKKDFILAVR